MESQENETYIINVEKERVRDIFRGVAIAVPVEFAYPLLSIWALPLMTSIELLSTALVYEFVPVTLALGKSAGLLNRDPEEC